MGSGTAIKEAVKKYGEENFKKEILEYFDSDDEMFKREREVVNEEFIKNPKTYNIALGGRGTGSGENHPMFGKKKSEYTIFLMKKNNPRRGVPLTQAEKDIISKANKGRKHSDEVNKKKGRSGKLNHSYGKTGTATGKNWINDGKSSMLVDLKKHKLEDPWRLGLIPKCLKAVVKIDKKTGEILDYYKSMKEAGERNNVSRHSISACCSGKLKAAGGFRWKLK